MNKIFPKIGIIGGTGEMGTMFAHHFRESGREVFISDEKTLHSEKILLKKADLIILSVPIASSINVLQRIQPALRKKQLFIDFTSVKYQIIPEMLKLKTPAISVHPMFGETKKMAYQSIIIMPLNDKKYCEDLIKFFREFHLNVHIINEWKKHDYYMAIIQSLLHFIHITFVQTLSHLNVDIEELLPMCSPIYKGHLAFACRIIEKNPDLYSHIIIDNPQANIIQDFLGIAQENYSLVHNKDINAFEKKIVSLQKYLSSTMKDFNQLSNTLLEKIKDFNETEKR